MDFDAIYPETAEPYKSQLRRFRQTHNSRVAVSKGARWEYLVGGRGDETVLALHGGGGPAESIFRYIMAFEESYRVIAPTIPSEVTTVAEVLNALLMILQEEGTSSVQLFGVSNGGMIGQCLLRRDPEKVQTLILFHSMLPSAEYGKKFRRRARGLSLIPRFITVIFGRYWLNKQIRGEAANSTPSEQAFWIAYFKEFYDSELVTKAYFVSRAKILTDYFSNYQFEPGDLNEWPGRILILESENDQIVSTSERERLKSFYNQASVHTFRGAGHLGGGLFKVEESVGLIKEFLSSSYPGSH